jgi:hypothetical protein
MNDDPIPAYLPTMTAKRHASLVALVRRPARGGSMMAHLQENARVELAAFRMGGGRIYRPRGVAPARIARQRSR